MSLYGIRTACSGVRNGTAVSSPRIRIDANAVLPCRLLSSTQSAAKDQNPVFGPYGTQEHGFDCICAVSCSHNQWAFADLIVAATHLLAYGNIGSKFSPGG